MGRDSTGRPPQVTAVRVGLAVLASALAAVPLLACERGEAPALEGPSRPPTTLDSLPVGDSLAAVRLELYRSPPEFPLAFSTYLPPGMSTEADSDGDDGAGLRLVVEGADTLSQTYLHLFVFAPGTSEEHARSQAEQFAMSLRVPVSRGEGPVVAQRQPHEFNWAFSESGFRYERAEAGWYVGTVALGEHGNRFFQVVLHYPEPLEQIVLPRMLLALEHWVWSDSGRPLEAAL